MKQLRQDRLLHDRENLECALAEVLSGANGELSDEDREIFRDLLIVRIAKIDSDLEAERFRTD